MIVLKCFTSAEWGSWQPGGGRRMLAYLRRRSDGFTLVELLVVIAIIGILVALLLPAIQAARESARRAQCTSNLKNIALAVHSYHDSKKELPATAWVEPEPNATDVLTNSRLYWNWALWILPYLEETALFDMLSLSSSCNRKLGC